MPKIIVVCHECNGEGSAIETLPATQYEPPRIVRCGCTVCGGAGNKTTVPEEWPLTKEDRIYYNSLGKLSTGSGKVEIYYEFAGGSCPYCGGTACDKCLKTGKNIRVTKQLPYRRLFGWRL